MSRPRYPPIRRGPDGLLCRGCGSPIPRRKDGGEDCRKTWWSVRCRERFDPRNVFSRVLARCGGKCEGCGIDSAFLEYDHIVPFSEGGGTVDENMQALCMSCHRAKTKAWHAEKARQRRRDRQRMPLFDSSGLRLD